MKFKIILTLITLLLSVSFLSTKVNADPLFVEKLTQQMKSGLDSGIIVRKTEWNAKIQTKCSAIKAENEALFAKVDIFLNKPCINGEEAQKLFDSTQGTTKDKIKPVLSYLDRVRDEMRQYYRENYGKLKQELKPRLKKAESILESAENELKNKRYSAQIPNYGTHCAFDIVKEDVRQAIKNAEYFKGEDTAIVNDGWWSIDDFIDVRTIENEDADSTRDLVIDFKIDDNSLDCLKSIVGDLKNRIKTVSDRDDYWDNTIDSAKDAWELKPDIEDFEKEVAKIREDIDKKIKEKTLGVLDIIPYQDMRDPMQELTERAMEIIQIDYLDVVETRFEPGERSSDELEYIIENLEQLLREAHYLHKQMKFNQTVSTELPMISYDIDDPRPRDNDWEYEYEDFTRSVNGAVRDSIYARTGSRNIILNAYRPLSSNWFKKTVRWCMEWANQDWKYYCELNGFEDWNTNVSKALEMAKKVSCAVAEREVQDVPQFDSEILFVPTSDVKAEEED